MAFSANFFLGFFEKSHFYFECPDSPQFPQTRPVYFPADELFRFFIVPEAGP